MSQGSSERAPADAPTGTLRRLAGERYGPSVLAVGSGGRSGARGPSLGATTTWLLNEAACPVLIARRRLTRREPTER